MSASSAVAAATAIAWVASGSGVGSCRVSRRACGASAARGRTGPGCRRPGRPCSGSISSGSGPRRRLRTPLARAGRTRSARRAAEHPVAERRELDRHLVDRRRGDHQDPEERQQQQQRHHDVRRAEQVEQQARDDVPDRAAGVLQVGGVAVDRARVAGGDVDGAEHAEGRGPPSRRPGGRPGRCSRGRAWLRQPTQTSISGTSQPTLPTEPATTVRTPVHQAAGQLPPDGGRDDDGEAEQEQPDAVAPVLGLEVVGGPADLAGDGADGVGDAEPDRGDPAAERGEQRAAPDRAPSGRLGAPDAGVRTCGIASSSSYSGIATTGFEVVAPASRTRRGRRTGRHGDESRSPSLPSHGSHAAQRPASRGRFRPPLEQPADVLRLAEVRRSPR